MLGSIAEQCIRSDQVEFSDRCDSIGCGIFSRNQRKFLHFFSFLISSFMEGLQTICEYSSFLI